MIESYILIRRNMIIHNAVPRLLDQHRKVRKRSKEYDPREKIQSSARK